MVTILFILFGAFFIGCLFMDVTADEDDERQVTICRNLTLIGGGILMVAVFAVALL